MEFKLNVKLGNSAMQSLDDVADLLNKLASRLRGRGEPTGGEGGRLMDLNGNGVGSWTVEDPTGLGD